MDTTTAAPRPLDLLVARAAGAGAPVPCAVAHPCDRASLEGALDAMRAGLIHPILVGPEARIRGVAQDSGLDLGDAEIVPAPHSHGSAQRAVALVREGRALALMKGSLHTDELMAEIVARDTGLRTERRVTHVFALDVPMYPKPLFVTDAAVNISPDLETKADICRNAIELCHALGIARPRVAVLSAVETVTPKLPATIEAAALAKMAERGQITGAVVDGPFAFDNAINAEAARAKGIGGEVAGQADVLVVPDLEAGNMLAKQLQYLAGAEAAGIVLGARVPVALTSRADGPRARLGSAALLRMLVAHRAARAGVGD